MNELTGKDRKHIETGLGHLLDNPYTGKELKGELKGYWSYRAGNYRIIYCLLKKEILIQVLKIQHRKEVYERLRRG